MRFPGFEGEWETKTLGEIGEINPNNKKLPSSFVYIDLESVSNGRLLKEEFINEEEAPSRAQRMLEKGDILFQMVRPYQKNNLFFNKEGRYVASTGYAQIRTKQNPQFVFQYLHNQKFVDKVIERCTGTSYPAINSSNLGNIHILYPKLNEQQKIANFLSLIDERIATQNKIIEELKDLIKSVSEKLFSQKMRFDVFSDNWKVIALGDFLVEQNVKTKMSNEYRVLSSTTKGLFYQSEYFNKDIASKDNSGYKILRRNQLVFSPQNLWLGNINVNNTFDIGIVSPSYKVFSFDESSIIINYFKFLAKTPKMMFEYEQCSEQGASIVRRSLNMELFFNITLHIPTIKEQIKISDFLCLIDSKIEIEIQLLQKLEKQKEYLLKKLFV